VDQVKALSGQHVHLPPGHQMRCDERSQRHSCPCPRTMCPVCEAHWSLTTPALAGRHVVGSRVCLPLRRKTWFHLPVEPARAEHPEDRLAELPGRPRFRLPGSPSTSGCQQNPAEAQADPPRAWPPPLAFCRRNRGLAWRRLHASLPHPIQAGPPSGDRGSDPSLGTDLHLPAYRWCPGLLLH
jgi:hypothetical protein